MKNESLAIATISWARNEEEEDLLQTSLQKLSSLNYPVFITDGGSSETFLHFLRSLPQFSVLAAKGLWPQAKNSIEAASASGAKTILYTEPDKLDFFLNHLPQLVTGNTFAEGDGVLIASRSAKGFSSFPVFQQMTEQTINNCCSEVMGMEVDYCYGPFLFNATLVPYLTSLPENCGWGWRPFLFAIAHRLGLRLKLYKGDFNCPADQRSDNEKERLYRMKQLTQNIEGLVLATTIDLS